MNRIPKIIHYCWFGKGEIPEALEECMKSWKVLKQAGYESYDGTSLIVPLMRMIL